MKKKSPLTHKEMTSTIIIILMLIGSFSLIKPFDKEIEAIVILTGEPLTSIALKHQLTLDNPLIRKIAQEKLIELKGLITDIQNMGTPLQVESYLITTILGAIVKVPSRYIPTINQTGKVVVFQESRTYKLNLQNSVKMVDAKRAWGQRDTVNNNITGKGIRIAVVDTGVNYSLPILGGGIGSGYKVVGGYDFVDKDKDPMDIDGHGTAVAAIIAGRDNRLLGVAPDASILAYRAVSERKETSTSLIVQAVDRAVSDGADVINLSLGSDVTDTALGKVIANAVSAGVVVVAAAGNSGPNSETIEYPSALNNVISVGASSNLNSSSLKAEFSVIELGKSFEAVPMNKTVSTKNPLIGRLVYVGLAGEKDVENMDLKDSIAIAKRGIYYFSDKAKNVYEKGAIALIVFNNLTGNFIGGLKDPTPIPVLSISGKDGEAILNALKQMSLQANFSITLNPYQVIWFSSRGPASPFYIKPNLIAPGYEVETADYRGGYTTISGTSFAAPHVAGAIALIKQVRPNLNPYQIMCLLTDNSVPLSTGKERYSVDSQGGGLMEVYNTLVSDFVVTPGSLVFHLSPWNQTTEQRTLEVTSLSPSNLTLTVSQNWDGPDNVTIKLKDKKFVNRSIYVTIEAELNTKGYGTFYGWLNMSSSKVTQRIPIRIQVDPIGITMMKITEGKATFKINHPTDFTIATVLVQIPGGSNQTIYYINNTENITFSTPSSGEYWISILVNTGTEVLRGFEIIVVGKSSAQPTPTVTSVIIPGPPTAGIPYPALETIALTLVTVVISIVSYASIRNVRKKDQPELE